MTDCGLPANGSAARPGSRHPRTRRLAGWVTLIVLMALSTAQAAMAAGASTPPGPLASTSAHEVPDSSAGLDRLMGLLAQRKHGEITFTEHDTLAVLEAPWVSSGILIYDAPDHLEKRTLQPRPSTLVLDHGALTVSAGGHTYHLELSEHPRMAPYIEAITDTLSGNRAALEQVFRVKFAGTLAHWTLTLIPRTGRHSPIRSIRISGLRADLEEIVIDQAHGDRSQLTLGPSPAGP